MPARIVREGILTSERVEALSWQAEVFYRRLMSIVDDFGRFYAHPALIRAACFPLRLDRVSDSDLGKWLRETEKTGLVRAYQVEGKGYVQLLDFRQQVRAKESKFPNMPSVCIAPAVHPPDVCIASAHLDVDVDVDGLASSKPSVSPKLCPAAPNEPPATPISNAHDRKTAELREQAREVLTFLNAKAVRSFRPVPANVDPIVARFREGFGAKQMRQVIALKCRAWKGDEKMAPYLRPDTLFNRTKFANYAGELVEVPDDENLS